MGNTYSSNLNNNSVLSVDDISSGKIADIHEQMYQTALRKFITVINLGNPIETFYDNYTVIETRMSDYNEASLITLIDKHTQKTVRNISLENFWPKYNYKYTSNDDIVKVNVVTGRMIYEHPILSVGQGNFEINLSLCYNSQKVNRYFSDRKIGFGNGWKFNFHPKFSLGKRG